MKLTKHPNFRKQFVEPGVLLFIVNPVNPLLNFKSLFLVKRPRSPSPVASRSSMSSKSSKNRNRIESDESDYDSDMDDFIDDSDANPAQISSIIGKMFGYDRRKYR